MEDKTNNPYDEGYDECVKGRNFDREYFNPYPRNTTEYYQFEEGWYEAYYDSGFPV